MSRIHALLIAAAVGFAVVAGAFAAIRTTQLGAGSGNQVSPVVLANERAALDRTEAALKKSLRSHPPKLPPVPKAAPPTPATPRVRVVHAVRPQPVATTTPAVAPRVVATTPRTTTSSSPAGTSGREHEHDGHDDNGFESDD